MGVYINIGNEGFRSARNSEYVDKSGIIAVINSTLDTKQRFTCVTRCRRFGKSMAAEMLCAYYDHSCDSRSLFADLEIAKDSSFEQHLNQYPVIYLDLSDFVTRFKDEGIVDQMDSRLRRDLREAYPETPAEEDDDLMDLLVRIAVRHRQRFIFIIDEWDAICREFKAGSQTMDNYVHWLRRLFKGGNSGQVFAGVYMTGILPIKKYNTESALNNFVEYSMVEPMDMGHFFGFTKDEVRQLAHKYSADFDELVKWYDGYQIGDELSMFNPNSVMMALKSKRCRSFWGTTGAYEAVANYINMNFDGLKAVAEDIHARADELGFDAFSSSDMDSSSSWRFTGHMANLEYFYEERDAGGWTECPPALTGAYMAQRSFFSLIAMLVGCVLAVLFDIFGIPSLPFLMAFILSPMLENNVRKGIAYSHGISGFFTRPISCALIIVGTLTLLYGFIAPAIKRGKKSKNDEAIEEASELAD